MDENGAGDDSFLNVRAYAYFNEMSRKSRARAIWSWRIIGIVILHVT